MARLTALEIGPDGESLYRAVLRQPRLALDRHREVLGWSLPQVSAALEELRAHRLVRVGAETGLIADHPRAALERVVSAQEAQLATRRQELARVRDAIDAFVADYTAGQTLSTTTLPSREHVEAADVEATYEHLLAATAGEVRCCGLSPAGPGVAAQLASGRAVRWLHGAADGPVEAGEFDLRIAATLPTRFVCFGVDVALSAAEWGSPGGDFVVLRDPVVVAAFVELFDRLWATAAPVAIGEDAQASGVLDLMRQGLKDEAIARAQGVSLRTVRRRIASLMAEHGVDTRFQLALKLTERESGDED
ncbi:hypothetical protein ATK17_2862 [Branchiibius hedensis]|uniref:HTH luxR-type domain-containing protein n=1 Tax=Branchiibius hedensis TaxID=672460 RepID=A0A2Y8ZZ30_9MICO|nr:hypothetical protein [Branchiibius hedensis]PWJ26688.1 hypothetical protein ATK17_2862 [Branchiibius hedensis]SSA35499.1 hypothetical protein SAMN04489750_2862 [Branchiibius hedensis]